MSAAPAANVTEPVKLWLTAVYEKMTADPDVDVGDIWPDIWPELWDRLPRDFTPSQIDNALLRGDSLTLLGIWVVDPQSPYVSNTERVILAIKHRLEVEPRTAKVTAADLAGVLELEVAYVERLLGMLSGIGSFYGGASEGDSGRGYSWIGLDSQPVFHEYLRFENLESVLAARLETDPFASAGLVSPGQMANPLLISTSGNYLEATPPLPQYVPSTAFILMDMDRHKRGLSDVRDAIKEVCARFSIEARRADDIEHQDVITEVVLQQIAQSEFLIADLTNERPNVYYEIGFAHALRKRPILFRREGTDLHFDLAGYNVPEYENLGDLKEQLTRKLEAMTGRTPE
jgi:hypothetical protein